MGTVLSTKYLIYLTKKGAAALFYIYPKGRQLTKRPNRFTVLLI
jgi:hypothetical protein